jgi:hypothetical protein
VSRYNLLLALLLAPNISMADARRMKCFKELLLNSSRDHVALVDVCVCMCVCMR